VHRVAELHDTLSRMVGRSPRTSGVAWIDHVLPFHRSASESSLPLFPTAVQALAEVHETPLNLPPNLGLGVAWIDHVLPFHASARVNRSPLR
jgi:hypothetical protein